MRPHRFDPLSFVAGTVFAALGAILLWGRVDLHDLRPSALWAWPILTAGLLFTLYGVRRLIDERAAEEAAKEVAEEAADRTEGAADDDATPASGIRPGR
jgi:hypothetical protein